MASLNTYIRTEFGDLTPKDNSNIPINKSIKDIQDLSTRKGGYTKTILINGTKESNRIFSHYYDVNIIDGTFSHKKKMKAELIQDGIIVLSGFVRLLSISRESQTADSLNQFVVYQITITDETSSLFQNIGEQMLSSIDISNFDHIFNAANIVASSSNTYADGYKYIWPYTNDAEYKIEEFVPAVYAKIYFDSIFYYAGYTYDWDSIDEYKFKDILVTYNKKLSDQKDSIENNSVFGAIGTLSLPALTYTNTSSFNGISPNTIDLQDIVVDNNNNVDLINNKYFFSNYSGYDNNEIEFNIKYKVILTNSNPETVILGLYSTYIVAPSLYVYKNTIGGDSTDTFVNINNSQMETKALSAGLTIPSSSELIIIDEEVSLNFVNIGSNFLPSDSLIFGTRIESFVLNPLTRWYNLAGTVEKTVGIRYEIESITYTVKPSSKYISFNSRLKMNNFIPDIKSSEFIKGVFNHFNLYAEIDENNPTNVIIKGRDDYYNTGKEYDWSKKIALDKANNIEFTSEKLGKNFFLQYTTGADEINKGYNANTGSEYGKLQYIFNSEFATGDSIIKVPWVPTPIIRTTFGAYTAGFNALAKEDIGLRFLYDGGARDSKVYDIIDYTNIELYTQLDEDVNPDNEKGSVKSTTDVKTEFETYNYAGHWDNPENPSWDLNFGICDYYFYNNYSGITINNMYNLHWARSLEQIENGRILTAYFDLIPSDMETIRLNDRIWIKDAWWNILEIIDYQANANTLTKVKLITIDSEQPLNINGISSTTIVNGSGPSGTGVTQTPGPGSTLVNLPISGLVKSKEVTQNLVYTTGQVQILGTGNLVKEGTKNIIIQGNNNVIEAGIENVTIIGNNLSASKSNSLITNNSNYLIRKTLLEMKDLINDSLLLENSNYLITDRDIIIYSIKDNKLSNDCKIKRTSAANEFYEISGVNKGVFNNMNPPTLVLNDIYVWGSKVWKVILAGVSPNALNVYNLSPLNFVLLTDPIYYETSWFKCSYDILNDMVYSIEDNNGNIYNINWVTYTSLYDELNDYHNNSIYLNNTSGILNNISNTIYNNILLNGKIINNISNTINYNRCNSISFNKSSTIVNNTNTGDITSNLNSGYIRNNSNIGGIVNNKALVINIFDNSNVGVISTNNNTGSIYKNKNNGQIYYNSNNGNVALNTNNGDISSCTNLGSINNNINNGEINSASSAGSITDTIVNK